MSKTHFVSLTKTMMDAIQEELTTTLILDKKEYSTISVNDLLVLCYEGKDEDYKLEDFTLYTAKTIEYLKVRKSNKYFYYITLGKLSFSIEPNEQ